ncbi:MAG: DUF6438 domain-containing protein [Bacteroidota bacterium]
MNHFWPLVIAFLLSLMACKSSQEAAVPSTIPEDFQLILTRSGCKGRCPSYVLFVDREGNVAYEGQMFVPNVGQFTKTISSKEVKAIYEAIEAADFWEREARYDDPNIMDLPTSSLEVRKSGTTHKVVCRFNVPQEMVDLMTAIDTIVGENGFKEVKK